MEEWNQSNEGRWSLNICDSSLSLPNSFVVESQTETSICFVDDGPDLPSCRVVYKQEPASSYTFDPNEYKQLREFRASGVLIREFAPTTKSGRAKAGVRMYLIGLSSDASLMVIDGTDHHARLLAKQLPENNEV